MHPNENDDLKLIANNWDVLQPAAEHGFEEHGFEQNSIENRRSNPLLLERGC